MGVVDLDDIIRHIVIEARDARCAAQEDLVAGAQSMAGFEGDRVGGWSLATCVDVDDREHGDRSDDGVALGIAIGLPVGVVVLGRGALLRPDGAPRGVRRQAAAELQVCGERVRLGFGQRLRLLEKGVEKFAVGRLERHVTAFGRDRTQLGRPQRRRDEPEVAGGFEDEDAVLCLGGQAARSTRVAIDPDRLARRADAARRGQQFDAVALNQRTPIRCRDAMRGPQDDVAAGLQLIQHQSALVVRGHGRQVDVAARSDRHGATASVDGRAEVAGHSDGD